MRFYLASSFLFPRSFRLRLFAICFVATHVPLLSYVGWGAATGRLTLAEFVLLLVATMVGMAIALFGYWVVGMGTAILFGFGLGWGGVGIWTGLAAGLAVVAVLMLGRWLRRDRLGLVPVGPHGVST